MFWKEVAIIFGVVLEVFASQVIELDDRFTENKGDHSWLVEFYAPWCGHCRKLEPVFNEVAETLRSSSNIFVGKVDATRFSSLASEFGVRGYPTIKFIQGDRVLTHKGDRSKEGIVEFAKRAKGPHIRPVTSEGVFKSVQNEHRDFVFYLYIGPQDDQIDLFSIYKNLSTKYSVSSYYYAGDKNILPKDVTLKTEPTLLVFKDGLYFEFDGRDDGPTIESLEKFMVEERYPAFPQITGGALNEMVDMNKKLVIVVTNEKNNKKKNKQKRFKNMVKEIATKEREKYYKEYQFIWMGESDTVNSITMSTLSVPNLIVLDPETQYYYLPEGKAEAMTAELLRELLQNISQGSATAYGGNGLGHRFKRLFYDIRMTVYEIYSQSPWLALLVFGVPTGVIGIVAYALCCMEPIDEDSMEEEEDYTDEEGRPSPDDIEHADAMATSNTKNTDHMKTE